MHRWEDNPEDTDMLLTIIVFLAKPQGGVRPIGLLPLFGRIWSRLRHSEVAKWEGTLGDSFFWGSSSETSCDKSAWIHNVLASVAP
eukprot:758744-Pyramimonas_sp.AAC.1